MRNLNTRLGCEAHRYERGFSIIELMVAVAVAALLLGLAIPSFRELNIRNRVTESTNELVYAMNIARSEAVRRGTKVKVVSTSTTGAWSSGWSVAADTAFDNSYATVITTRGALPAGYTVCGATNGGTDGDSTIVFSAFGSLTNNASGFDINVNRPDGNKKLSQRVSVQGSGEVKTKTDTTGSPAAPSC